MKSFWVWGKSGWIMRITAPERSLEDHGCLQRVHFLPPLHTHVQVLKMRKHSCVVLHLEWIPWLHFTCTVKKEPYSANLDLNSQPELGDGGWLAAIITNRKEACWSPAVAPWDHSRPSLWCFVLEKTKLKQKWGCSVRSLEHSCSLQTEMATRKHERPWYDSLDLTNDGEGTNHAWLQNKIQDTWKYLNLKSTHFLKYECPMPPLEHNYVRAYLLLT